MMGIFSGTMRTRLGHLNGRILLLVLLLSCFGLAMMYSAAGGSMAPWAWSQSIKLALGIGIMLFLALLPTEIILRYAYLVYAVCILALVGVEIAGYMGKGAQRWVDIGVVNLQPSELMKIAVILALARYFHYLHPDNVSRLVFLLPPILLILVPAVLILRQPNLGTTTILIAVGAVILFMAGVALRYFIIVAATGLAMMPLAWHFLHDYQKQRVMTFLDPQQDPLGAGYNILQSIIAIGSGGIFGKGFLNGSQGQLNFLPEKHTDFIFTMIAEEFGFFGSALVLLAYAALIFSALAVCLRARTLFARLLAAGVMGLLFAHIFINVAMIMGMIPVVGVPLPLLSYGGSIMLSIMAGFGLLLNADLQRSTNG